MSVQPLHADRIFRDDEYRWYFHVRGGASYGPFSSHAAAAEQLELYICTAQRKCSAVPALPRWLHLRYWRRCWRLFWDRKPTRLMSRYQPEPGRTSQR